MVAAAIVAALAGYLIWRNGRGGTQTMPGSTGPGTASGSPTTEAAELIAEARKEKGKPYSQANPQGPGHWDCSGLIQEIHGRLGYGLPRQVTEQAQQAPKQLSPLNWGSIDAMKAHLQPGDCLGSGTQENGRYKHTGLWTGSSMIHASSSRGEVVEDAGLGSYWYNNRRMVYRYIP